MQKLISWLRAKNRKRLEKRHAAKTPKVPPLQIDIDFQEKIDPLTLSIPQSDAPEVSIIIPGYGKADVTLRCLKSLITSHIECTFEVIVIEDASGDPSAESLKQVRGIHLIWNKQNLGFLRTCNMAATHAKGEYIYLLNNDTILLPQALDILVSTARKHTHAGIVGSKLVYPDGRLQEAGGIVWKNGDAANYGRNQDPTEPRFNYMREADYISGASILLKRSLWNDVGGFDERYAPAYYEDTDLSMRLQKLGHPTIYEPRSVVVHCEGVSNGTSTDHGIKAYQVVNREKFIAAHDDYLRKSRGHSGDLSYRAVDSLHRRAGLVLIIDHYLPEPDVDAGSRNMLEFIRTLISLNYVVKFWPQNLKDAPKYSSQLHQMGVETFRGPYQRSFDEWAVSNGKDITHVILSRPTVAPFYFDAVRRHTNARVIYYGHDLHYARMLMEAHVKKDPAIEAAARKMKETERNIWLRSDLVLYPSQEEIDEVRQQCSACHAEFVPPFQFDHFIERPQPTSGQKIIFVAGFQHSPNVDAATWLTQEVMPLVWARVPQLQLFLVGSKPTAQVQALSQAGRITVTGNVSVDELNAHYDTARIAVVPLRFGAGVKLKVLEAMQQGIPLVTTSIGLQGLPGLKNAASAFDEASAMAERICQLASDDQAWLQCSTQQTNYAKTHFSTEQMRSRFQQLLLSASEPACTV